jgi:predicted nuclease of predicted toxin-antitoxin system
MMKMIIDQGLPRGAAALMREAGYDAIHVGETGMAMASDREILKRASDEKWTVVTLDGDFHALLAQSQASSPSVVRIRIEGLRRYELARLLQLIIPDLEDDLKAGAVVTVQPGRLRVRRLPLA